MKKIAEVLLRAFLRRYPISTRLNLVSYLGQYAWLKDILEELKPELFPGRQETVEAVLPPEVAPAVVDDRILGLLQRSAVQGRLGLYKVETYLGARGNGHLFTAIETTSKSRVIIKEFLLLPTQFSKTDAYQRRNRFQQLAGMHLADGRQQDFRVIQPIEAIVDSESSERHFLVTDGRDGAPTLRQSLHRVRSLPPDRVRDILAQILQTLDFLHNQKFSFPSGAIQNGLVHGNLSLDSILWTEQAGQPFVYLCDLLLWEQCFDPTIQELCPSQVTDSSRQQDLQATGEIGMALLQGLDGGTVASLDPDFRLILDSLQTGKFPTAEVARRELLKLSPRSPTALATLQDSTAQAPPEKQIFSPLLALSLAGLVLGAFLLFPRLRSTRAQLPKPGSATCCLAEVSALPTGEFTYTGVEGGTWWTVLQQRNLLQRGQSLPAALALAQPKLQLRYVPAASLVDSLAQVRSGAVDFAILPLMEELPRDLLSQEIAYDGLVAVVSFSYAQRQQSLPASLKGKLTLEQVRQLYDGKVSRWNRVGGPDLEVERYVAANPEAIAIFEQRVLQTRPLQTLTAVKQLPSLDLLRQVIRDFEDGGVGSIGVTPLSEMWGQCSVYPLALQQRGQAAIQAMVLSNGQDLDPATDLCSRKGAYGPEPERFQTGQYPLSYPIVVVYPRDNRRSAMGKKFVELMRTVEGQRLLRAAGLVPLGREGISPAPTPAGG